MAMTIGHWLGRTRLLAKSHPSIAFVVGNASFDLDSLASALLLAHHLSVCASSSSPLLHIPLAAIQKDEFVLRQENLLLLQKCNIPVTDFPCLDDLSWLTTTKVSRVVLVDQNTLPRALSFFQDKVTRIIDHHVDEHVFPDIPATEKWITTAGSCTSLVIHAIKQDIDTGKRTLPLDRDEAYLGLGAIMIDTSGLKDETKTTKWDHQACFFLQHILRSTFSFPVKSLHNSTANNSNGVDGVDGEIKTWYKQLKHAKQHVRQLSSRDLLRRDYKEYTCKHIQQDSKVMTFGMSNAGNMPLADWFQREDAMKSWMSWLDEQHLDFLVVITTVHGDDGGQCELGILFPFQNADLTRIVNQLEANKDIQLARPGPPVILRSDYTLKWWQQRNPTWTRKQLAPLIQSFLKCIV